MAANAMALILVEPSSIPNTTFPASRTPQISSRVIKVVYTENLALGEKNFLKALFKTKTGLKAKTGSIRLSES